MKYNETLRRNRQAYDSMATANHPLCRTATDAELADPMAIIDSSGWLGSSIAGQRVLCLAAGGGRHSALYAAAGAYVTVVDLSPAMLELDRQVARERNFDIRVAEASMDNLSLFEPAEFDLVVQPVSSCYLPNVQIIYEQVARVLRTNGVYISQHKNPVSLQSSVDIIEIGGGSSSHCHYGIRHAYYRDSPIPPPSSRSPVAARLREPGSIEYLHRYEQLVGGLCRSGFVIEDLVEPVHAEQDAAIGSFAHRAKFVAPYLRIKARRTNSLTTSSDASSCNKLWVPS
ncbi:bifunctional 3-demethylubiquinone-9 3-methyltransferase/ 2-octaprenyl-6-hydroxy phenol methylase [Novipirellula aureliae]|uniref:Bifunctional 3-demethylubiquinone-9 3-methyltransferase/ 2-octaprenyl-6-hydroxy phenol methylase n=1 Tax=Novipirellula aureliae TaxID=2527966 RepID=A0A5C6DJ88_9BACT|nr:class I SAM-dependent methyltransferase [Novipirellula aureliae]TWU36662.1 bifunctional 3-demethylubiquinone-9 3-methyltransferase/ 2-octaprenyl-6-hydroxy phenol methylase [Novipirellula aureliae]